MVIAMNDTDNAIAPILYEYIVDFEKEIYKNEERREDSLMQQAANMQMVFSFVSAAVLMITPTIFEYRGALSVEFIILVISSIAGSLIGSLFCATKAQKRYQRRLFPSADAFQRQVECEYLNFVSESQRNKYLADIYSDVHQSLETTNEKRVRWINYSMKCFFLSLGLCIFWFVAILIKLL